MQENIDPINPINRERTLSSAVDSMPAKPIAGASPGVSPASEVGSSEPIESQPTPEPEPATAPPKPPVPPPGQVGFPRFGLIMSLFIGMVALLIGVAAYYMGWVDGQKLAPTPAPTSSPGYIEITPPYSPMPPEETTMCTMDAMMCPDGSYVGRTGPNCEFVCPGGTASSGALPTRDLPLMIDPAPAVIDVGN